MFRTNLAGFVGFVITVHKYSISVKPTWNQPFRAAGFVVLYHNQLDESAELRSKTR